MKIRATSKLLKISRITPEVDDSSTSESMPGEWFAQQISLGETGKIGIHFLHYPTYISVIVTTKSLNRGLDLLRDKVVDFLKRNDFDFLLERFQLDTSITILKNNNRSVRSHQTQMKKIIEYQTADGSFSLENTEDFLMNYLLGSSKTPGKYVTAKEIITKMIDEF